MKTRPYMAEDTPISRTRPALRAKASDSTSGRPNSFTSRAPATLKRSVMVCPMAPFRVYCSRVMAWSRRPTNRAGSMNSGRRARARSVICHESANIAANVAATPTTLPTTLDSVEVNACCAPCTSPFSRVTRAPVWVRLKNATGICWTWSKTWVRRSYTKPSPIRAEYHRSASPSAAETAASAATTPASAMTTLVCPGTIPRSMMAL